jgi:hypothetical protein
MASGARVRSFTSPSSSKKSWVLSLPPASMPKRSLLSVAEYSAPETRSS